MFDNLSRFLGGSILWLGVATSGCAELSTNTIQSKCELRDVYGESEARNHLEEARKHRASAWYQSDTVSGNCKLWLSQYKSDAAQELVKAKSETEEARKRAQTATICDADVSKLQADINQSAVEDTALENHLNGRCVTPSTPPSS